MNDGIISALIALGGIIIGVVLKHFLYDRKNYAKLIEALGNVKPRERSLYALLGVKTDTGSIASMIGDTDRSIASMIGDTDRSIASMIGDTDSNIASMIGDTSDGNLRSQHNKILDEIAKVNDRAAETDRRNAMLSSDIRTVTEAIEKLNAFKYLLEREHAENIEFRRRAYTFSRETGAEAASTHVSVDNEPVTLATADRSGYEQSSYDSGHAQNNERDR